MGEGEAERRGSTEALRRSSCMRASSCPFSRATAPGVSGVALLGGALCACPSQPSPLRSQHAESGRLKA